MKNLSAVSVLIVFFARSSYKKKKNAKTLIKKKNNKFHEQLLRHFLSLHQRLFDSTKIVSSSFVFLFFCLDPKRKTNNHYDEDAVEWGKGIAKVMLEGNEAAVNIKIYLLKLLSTEQLSEERKRKHLSLNLFERFNFLINIHSLTQGVERGFMASTNENDIACKFNYSFS